MGDLVEAAGAGHPLLDQQLLDVPDRLLDLVPAAVYVCDRDGIIARYNRRAVELWGRAPKPGDPEERFCGSHRLYRLDGGPLPHDQCPMADVLRTGIAVRDQELVIERPDGSCIFALASIDPLEDAAGRIAGAVNCFRDITDQKRARAGRGPDATAARRARGAPSPHNGNRTIQLQEAGNPHELLQALPAAVYTTDAAGRITFYNEAAAALWGCRPELGKSAFCGSWKLYRTDGTPMPHDECPMALALKEGRPIKGMEAVAERPDGTRVRFTPYPTPLFDAAGTLTGAVNMLVDVTERCRIEEQIRESESRYRGIFENARVGVWEEDFSAVVAMLDELRADGVDDLRAYFRARPERLAEALRRVRLNGVNGYAVELLEADGKEMLLRSLEDFFLPETEPVFVEELVALWQGRRRFESETVVQTLKGRRLDVVFTMAFEGERCERTLVSIFDISAQKAAERALREQTRRLETLNRVAKSISSNLELDAVVQTVTDVATELSCAQFGAFFYNVSDQQGERYVLYTLSGAPHAAFERFGLPRNTAVFEPTFRGTGVVRSDDIRNDPRYGRNPPHHGMPKGHLPVASYLAVPVVSRSGEVHGGLFFGHHEPGVFTEASEDVVIAIAAHAAIAIDNAHLHRAAQAELQERRRAEQVGQRLASIVESSDVAIVSQALDGVIGSWNPAAERLFGYSAKQAIGKPITILLPADRKDEEAGLLERIQRGERVDQYETVRRRRDGSLVDISLTVSPIRNGDEVVGASQIARDNTERRRAQEQQTLLIKEMHHRVRNLFALAGSVVALSSRSARTAGEMAEAVQGRLGALARAHELTMPHLTLAGETPDPTTTLHELTREILSPYLDPASVTDPAVVIGGPEVAIGGRAITSLALLLHEFATNAAKHGALSCPEGRVHVDWSVQEHDLLLRWREQGGPTLDGRAQGEGFGSLLVRGTVQGQFGGRMSRDWGADGLTMTLTLPLARLSG